MKDRIPSQLRLRNLLCLVLISLIFSSCVISKVQVGNYNSIDCKEKVYRDTKDIYLFWDLIPLKRTDKKIKIKDYEKIVKRNFFDTFLFITTGGIFSMYSVKIKTKNCESEQSK